MIGCLPLLYETCHFFIVIKIVNLFVLLDFYEERERESGAKLFLNSKTKEGIVKDGS